MDYVFIAVLLVVIMLLAKRTFKSNNRRFIEANIEREVTEHVQRLVRSTPEFFDQTKPYSQLDSRLEFEFKYLPLYRAAFKRRGVILMEAPLKTQLHGYSHMLRYGRNTIPVKNFVDITAISTVVV